MINALTCPAPMPALTYAPMPAGLDWVRDCLELAFPVDDVVARPAFRWAALPGRRATKARPKPHASTPARIAAAAPKQAERRREPRAQMSVYRSAMVRWEGAESFCLIRNISSGGLMAKLPATLAADQPVTVEMRSGQTLDGRVAWCAGGHVGVHFDAAIDVDEALVGPHRKCASWTQRMPRLAIGDAATLHANAGVQPATLLDLSQGGAKIEAAFVRPGDEVVLAVKGLEPRRGTICWVREGRAGIAFLASIPFDRLAAWALERQGLAPAD